MIKMWKLCNLLGGLLIILDFTNGGMVPLNNAPSKARPLKPILSSSSPSGALIGNINIPATITSMGSNLPSLSTNQSILSQPLTMPSVSLPSSSLLSAFNVPQNSEAPPPSTNPVPSPAPEKPQVTPANPPQQSVSQAPAAPPANPAQLPPSSMSVSPSNYPPNSGQSIPPGMPPSPHHPMPGAPAATFASPHRPPNYASTSAVGNSQSQVTYSQHVPGSSPVIVTTSVNGAPNAEATAGISDGVNSILESVSPISEPQQLLQQINPANVHGAVESIHYDEQYQLSNTVSNNLIQHVSLEAEHQHLQQVPLQSEHPQQIEENEEEEEEETPQFNLEAYLAQANLVLSNNANYYSPPPTVTDTEEVVAELSVPVVPAGDVDVILPVQSVEHVVPPSIHAPIENVPVEQPQLISVPPASFTPNVSGHAGGDSIVILSSVGSFGTNSVNVINIDPVISQAETSVTLPQGQETVSVNSDSNLQQSAPAATLSSSFGQDTPELNSQGTIQETLMGSGNNGQNIHQQVVIQQVPTQQVLTQQVPTQQIPTQQDIVVAVAPQHEVYPVIPNATVPEPIVPESHDAPATPLAQEPAQQSPQNPANPSNTPISSSASQLPPAMTNEQPSINTESIQPIQTPTDQQEPIAPPPQAPQPLQPINESVMPQAEISSQQPIPIQEYDNLSYEPELNHSPYDQNLTSDSNYSNDIPVDSHTYSEPASPDLSSQAHIMESHSQTPVQSPPSENQETEFTPHDDELHAPVPVLQHTPPYSEPQNIIFEATITNADNFNGAPNANAEVESLEAGSPAPPGYIFVPLNIPADAEGTITISAVPLNDPNNEGSASEEDYEEYPPFNVDQYLAQAALYLGSPQYGNGNLKQQIDSYGNFQSSPEELQSGEIDGAIRIIQAPSLVHDYSSSTNDVSVEGSEPEPEPFVVHVASVPGQESGHMPEYHQGAPPPAPINLALYPSEVDFDNNQAAHFTHGESLISSSYVETLQQPYTVGPAESQPHQGTIDIEPAHYELQESQHIASLLDDNLTLNELPGQELSDTSALEALAAESDSDSSLDPQTLIPINLHSVTDNRNEHYKNIGGNGDSMQTYDLNYASASVQDQSMETERSKPPMRPIGSFGLVGRPQMGLSSMNGPFGMGGRPHMGMGMGLSPMSMNSALSMIGRPSQMGISPMHSYTGNKLNQLLSSSGLPSMSQDEKYISGTIQQSKNQNNGSFIIHDNKNPQNGMVSVMGNTIFNSHVSGDQPTQFTIPANAASFIMAQGQKLPFNLSPSFDSILRPPQTDSLANASDIAASYNIPSNDNIIAEDNDNQPSTSSQYNNYYYPEDSIRNATVLIQNGLMRPLTSPVFLVVNTNSEKQGSSQTEVKVLPDQIGSFNNSHNVNYVSFNAENAVKREGRNNTGNNIHLVKRTAPNPKSIVSGGNVTAPIPEGSGNSIEADSLSNDINSNMNITNTVSSSQSPTQGISQVEVIGNDKTNGKSKLIDKVLQVQPEQMHLASESQISQNKIAEESVETKEEVQKDTTAPLPQVPAPQPQSATEKENPRPLNKEPDQKAVHPEAPAKEKNAAPSKDLPPPPASQQQSAPPRAPPPRDGPPSGGPSLPQPPPAPDLIGLPTVPDALSVPGGLGDIIIPQPNINAPTVPDLSVSFPTVPKPPGDTKGLGKGKPKPSKNKPSQNSNPPQGSNAPVPQSPQQPHQPIAQQQQQQPNTYTSPPMSELPLSLPQLPSMPQYQQQYEAPVEMGEDVTDDYSNKYDENDEDDEDMDNDDDNYEKANDSDEPISAVMPPPSPSIPVVPMPTIEKGLPGKYGGNGNGNSNSNVNSKPSVVPSVATFAANYGNSPAPGSSVTASGTYSNNPNSNKNNSPSTDKGCSCNGNNNNVNNNKNESNDSAQSSGNSGGRNKPAPPHSASQIEEEVESEDSEHSNVRPPKPNKPKRPQRPHMGSKKPKPKPGEKNADKFKDIDNEEDEGLGHMKLVAVLTKPNYSELKEVHQNKEEDPTSDASLSIDEEDEGLGHMKLVAVLTKPNYSEYKEVHQNKEEDRNSDASASSFSNDEEEEGPGHMKLVAALNKPNYLELNDAHKNKEEDRTNDESSSNDEGEGESENEVAKEKPTVPIKVTFVSNNDTKPNDSIKLTFVSTNGDGSKSVPIRVTFVNSGKNPLEREVENPPAPIKITLVSSNSTKANNATSVPVVESEEIPEEPEPVPTPVKQSGFLTTVKWFGWEIPTVNWSYFSDMFTNFFGKNVRTSSGEFACDELDEESSIMRSEFDVDYLCGESNDNGNGRMMEGGLQIDSNVCNMFCNSNGYHSGVCMPLKSCLCYFSEEKNYAIKLDRLHDYNKNFNSTEKLPLPSSAGDDLQENTCSNCRCLKSCKDHGKFVGYCSKSCHCGVPWYNDYQEGNLQPT